MAGCESGQKRGLEAQCTWHFMLVERDHHKGMVEGEVSGGHGLGGSNTKATHPPNHPGSHTQAAPHEHRERDTPEVFMHEGRFCWHMRS